LKDSIIPVPVMKNHFTLTITLICILPILSFGQKHNDVVFFPKQRIFKALWLDPNEAQAYGSVNLYWEENEKQNKAYLPFGFGFYKSLVRINGRRPVELGFDLSAHIQFEWLEAGGKFVRNILNTDYKISFVASRQLDEHHALRLRVYHVSSHLGDDYLIQNNIGSYFPNPNNYEQLDLTWRRSGDRLDVYGGMGVVIRPETIRKRLSMQAGAYFDQPLREGSLPAGFIAGADVKILQQNDFNPGLKLAAGLRLGNKAARPMRFILEFYRGNLPYSPFEFKRVQWLGLGLNFSPS
jgi:Protein of unknown function (DUF1207)